jgi:hypothetical protein
VSWLIARDRSLRDTDVAPHTVEIAATTVTFLVALAASLIFPASGFVPLLLLVLAEPIANRLNAVEPRPRFLVSVSRGTWEAA